MNMPYLLSYNIFNHFNLFYYIMIFYLLLIALPLIYFFFIRKNTANERLSKKDKRTNKSKNQDVKDDTKPSESNEINKTEENSREKKEIPSSKDLIVSHFRESKEILSVDFSSEGNTVIFHDEKKFYLVLNEDSTYYLNKNIHIYSKSVEYDVISHCSFSADKKIMAVALKNSKEIHFYELKAQDSKLKFVKMNKSIKTERKFDIKKVAITSDAQYVITSGSSQDTQIQIFDVSKCQLVQAIDINEIENEDLRLTPDSDYIAVITAMYNIASIAISRTSHHIKNAQTEEINVKLEKKKSVSVKDPISAFSFCNLGSFFTVLTKDSKIYVFQNYGQFPESKVHFELKALSKATASSAFIIKENHRIEGFCVYSSDKSLHLHDLTTGKEIKEVINIADTSIITVKLISIKGGLYCIVVSRDGKFNVVDLKVTV